MKSYNPKYSRLKITQMDYYAHLLAPRAEFSQFKIAGKLRCQFILHAYMKTEANRLNYIRLNQPQLRAELYKGLMDHLDNRAQNEGITVGIPCDVFLFLIFRSSSGVGEEDVKGGAKTPSKTQGG